jgi:hypothetical protein
MRFSKELFCGISIAVGEKAMKIKLFWLLTVSLVACLHVADAQQAKKIPSIGCLFSTDGTQIPFRQALRDLGYIEGKNIQVEYPSTH